MLLISNWFALPLAEALKDCAIFANHFLRGIGIDMFLFKNAD
jgi:hypothetical protein